MATEEILATDDFCFILSAVSAAVRLRDGCGNSLSPELRAWQAQRYSDDAAEALTDWCDTLATAESDPEETSDALSRLRQGAAHARPVAGGGDPDRAI